VRVLLVLVHLRTNLTTRAPAVLVATSQSATDPIIGHLVPTLATALRPPPAAHANTPWMIDDTLIAVHDQSITAPSKNYRRSINTPDRHLLAQPGRGGRRGLLARQPPRRRARPRNHRAPDHRSARHPLTAATAASTPSAHRPATTPGTSSATTTTQSIAASVPVSNTSSPGSNTARSCGNATAAARPSTTASTSSPDYGTSKPQPHRRFNNHWTITGRLFRARAPRGPRGRNRRADPRSVDILRSRR
jgi:hypothetical protein